MNRSHFLLRNVGFALSFLFAASLLSPAFLNAQDGVETSGSITAGYRFTDVSGRREKFNELFSLRDGFRLHDLSVYGRASDRSRFFDAYSLDASGIGGDPLAASQFRIAKDRRYDLRVNYRQSYFYWDRSDDQPHPAGFRGLASNHDFSTVRRIGSVDLSAYATDSLRVNVEYHRSGRDGTAFTTRTLEYFGAPASFAAFLRANPYSVESDIDETANRIAVGVSYSLRDWNVFYRAGYQRYVERLNLRNPVSSQRSINVDEAATANELLTTASWDEFRRVRTPVSEFSYNGRAYSRLTLRGGYIFYQFKGPAETNAVFTGRARTNTAGTTISPFDVTVNNTGTVEEPNHILDQGFTLELRDDLLFHTDYRYSRFSMDNAVTFNSVDDAGTHTGEEHVAWRHGVQILDLAFEWRPAAKVMIRPGMRLMKRDIRVTRDGVLDVQSSRPSKYASPLVSIYYAPTGRLSVRGDLRNTTNGGPYTRISPRTDFRTRWVAHYRVSDAVTLENNFTLRESEYATTEFKNKIRSNATTATYAINDHYSVFGGFIYDSYLATSAVTFLRGTAPLSATWRDQTVNRVWEAGIEARPNENVELRLSGNYLRTTGVGEISGEPPTAGPIRWPFVTGTIAVNVPGAGTLSLDLQRTYYIEEIMTGDNFSANLLGIRWTTEF